MTIKVTISNDDPPGSRTVLVTTVSYSSGSRDVQHQHLDPGCKSEFYIHALQDLRVEELLDPH